MEIRGNLNVSTDARKHSQLPEELAANDLEFGTDPPEIPVVRGNVALFLTQRLTNSCKEPLTYPCSNIKISHTFKSGESLTRHLAAGWTV
jgi:hypothetical protein